LEKHKFLRPNQPFYLRPWVVVAMLISGGLYTFMDKLYIEHRWLLDYGSRIPAQNPWAFVWIKRTRAKILVWLDTNIGLSFKDKKLRQLTSTNVKISPRKEMAMKAIQTDNYMKKRSGLFDYLYLGETEDFTN